MPTNTPDQQITLPIGVDSADNPVVFTNFVTDVEPKLVRTYADVADRALRQLVVAENEISGLAAEDRFDVYTGAIQVSLYTRALHARTRLAADHLLTMSNTVFQDVTGMALALATSSTFHVRGHFFYDSSTTADIKFAVTIPAGTSFRVGMQGLATTATTTTGDLTLATQSVSATSIAAFSGIGVGAIVYATLEGDVTTAGTAGNLQLQAAQNTSDATQSTVRARSYWECWRLS